MIWFRGKFTRAGFLAGKSNAHDGCWAGNLTFGEPQGDMTGALEKRMTSRPSSFPPIQVSKKGKFIGHFSIGNFEERREDRNPLFSIEYGRLRRILIVNLRGARCTVVENANGHVDEARGEALTEVEEIPENISTIWKTPRGHREALRKWFESEDWTIDVSIFIPSRRTGGSW